MKREEKGIALVITMFLMATLSALAVSMMFLANTETSSSRNYRTMSQARYAAEAGVQQMANYLMSATYPVPASPFTGYGITKSPVTCTAGCSHTTTTTCNPTTVALAVSTGCIVVGSSSATSNNPTATVNSGASGTLAVNGSGSTTNTAAGTVTYGSAAILMSMRSITAYGASTSSVIQSWLIVSDGTVPPSTSAIVEVSGVLERESGFAQTFAVFATDPNCAAITLGGGGGSDHLVTDSYDSTNPTDMATTPPAHTGLQGGIGTNGNLDIGGSLTIGGTLTTPRTGAGTCSASNPTAITGTGSWSYGGTVHLPQPLTYPPPAVPTGVPTDDVTISSGMDVSDCLDLVSGYGWSCAINTATNKVTLSPGPSPLALGNVTVGSNTELVIAGGGTQTLNVNSFKLGSNAKMSLLASPSTSAIVNIAGQSLGSTLPLDLSGGGNVNSSFDPSRLQFTYAGTGEIRVVGNNTIAATIYAPSAIAKTTGSGNLYGSVLAGRFDGGGNANIHYDTSLATRYQTLGNFMLTSFSWKKY
jgi:Tfp pilus assembly protein PilX